MNKIFHLLLILGLFYPTFLISDSNSIKAEESVLNEPYIYHYPPENSFGGAEYYKQVNWSYFKSLFRNNFDVSLIYNVNGGTWQNGNDYLGVNFDWQESGYWKINLSFNNPSNQDIDAIFKISMNIAVLDYVERAGDYAYYLNYTVPNSNGEVYSCFFNWSDLISVPGLIYNHGFDNNKFWMSFRKNSVPKGYHVFDPTFGFDTEDPDSAWSIFNYYVATMGTPASSGTVTKLTGYTNGWGNGEIVKPVIYDSDLNLVAVGDSKSTGGSNGWHDFTFSSPPSVTADESYFIGFHSDYYVSIYYSNDDQADGQGGMYRVSMADAGGDDPIESWNNEYTTYSLLCYATYTESGWSNTAPTIEANWPSNDSDDICLKPTCYVTVNDSDGNSSTVDFFSSTDGSSWTWRQTNSSILNTTVYWNYSQAKTSSTDYWWKVTANDGHDNTSISYNFTTVANASPPSLPPDNPPTISNPNPANESTGQELSFTYEVDFADSEGNFRWWMNSSHSETTSGGGNATGQLSLSDLDYNTVYWVNCTADDNDSDNVTVAKYKFTTKVYTPAGADDPPEISNPVPSNGSTDNSITISNFTVNITDPNGDFMNITFEMNNGQNYSENSCSNGTYALNFTGYLLFNTSYTVWVNLTDGINITSEWFNFSTAEEGYGDSDYFNESELIIWLTNNGYIKESDNVEITLGASLMLFIIWLAVLGYAMTNKSMIVKLLGGIFIAYSTTLIYSEYGTMFGTLANVFVIGGFIMTAILMIDVIKKSI